MTTLAATLIPPIFGASGGRLADIAVGRYLLGLEEQVQQHARLPATDWQSATESQLAEILATCGSAEWDSEGSLPVTVDTAAQARYLLELLRPLTPPGIPAPVLVPEADGELSLNWEADSGFLLSISIGEAGVANFASRLGGGDEWHGRARLDQGITDSVRRLAAVIAQVCASHRSVARS